MRRVDLVCGLACCLAVAASSPAWADPGISLGRSTITTNGIDCNFNGTAIPAGRTIWFNSVIKPQFSSGSPVTVYFRHQVIHFTANSSTFDLAVPDASITFDPSAGSAATNYDAGQAAWMTKTPYGLPGNEFLSGFGFASPGLPGGIQPVSWSGDFFVSSAGASFQWSWGAAVYTSFSADDNAVGSKPCDSNTASAYANSDHAGTPESYRTAVTGGATGGGGSNYTGSLCSTQSISSPTAAALHTWGELKSIYR
jgi:hypothetical protein